MTVSPPATDHSIKIPGFMPFFWLGCALLSGILIADRLNFPKLVWLILFLLCLLVWMLSLILKKAWLQTIRHPIISRLPIIVLAVFFFLGAWIYSASQPAITPAHPAYYNEKGLVQLTGVVIQPPDVRDTYTNLTVRVDSLFPLASDPPLVDPDKVSGRILLQVLPGRTYHYGDLVSLRGKLATPPDGTGFSYQDYLSRKGIHSLMNYAHIEVLDTNAASPILAAIYALKERSQGVLMNIFPSPESDLLSGILLGNDNGLSPELKDAYQLTGTTHIIAISGFNIAILAGLITALFNRWLGSRWGTLAAILTIGLYTILVGADAAVVRAAIMGSFGMLGVLIGRRGNGLNTLGLSALIMCLINPNLPWDVGFQLSFMATLGLVIYAAPLQSRFESLLSRYLKEESIKRVAAPVSEYILFTLVAQALVLPLLVYHFGRFSLSFLLANPLILPVQPLVMILGGVALLGGLINPGLGKVLAYLAWPFAAFTNRVVVWLAALFPNPLTLGSFSIVWVFIYYILFFALTLSKDKKALFSRIVKPATALIPLACMVMVVWSLAFSAPDGRLTLTLLPNTDSPTILLESPTGRFVLINGAGKASAMNQAVGSFLPLLNRQIDMLVIPSCKRDDVNGLGNLPGRVKISQVLWACDPDRIQTTRLLHQAFADAAIPQENIQQGAALDLGEGASLTLTYQSQDGSLLKVNWGDLTTLIAIGDPTSLAWKGETRATVLILPGDSDSDTVTPYNLQTLASQLVLLPLDPQSLPLSGEPPILARLEDYQVMRTDQQGWLELKTDGELLWLNAQRVR